MLSESEVSDEHHCSFRPALQGQRNFYRRPIMDAYFWKAESRVAAQNARSPVWGGDQLELHGKPNACIARANHCSVRGGATRRNGRVPNDDALNCVQSSERSVAEVNTAQRPITMQKSTEAGLSLMRDMALAIDEPVSPMPTSLMRWRSNTAVDTRTANVHALWPVLPSNRRHTNFQ
jgi:hypothetical protein